MDSAVYGTIPSSFSNLVNIGELYLRNNSLRGGLPNLERLNSLRILDVSSNGGLSGTIPGWLNGTTFSQMTELRMSGNQISGSIPVSLGSLSKLQVLNLNGNRLSGTIPCLHVNVDSLKKLWVGSNQLEGTIPDCLSTLRGLTSLLLNENRLIGSIPASLRSLGNLTRLDLSSNLLIGNFDLLNEVFLPAIVNVSMNALGPSVAPYMYVATGASPAFALVDISAGPGVTSNFVCPYPRRYPETVVVRRSACRQPWSDLEFYGLIILAALVGAGIVYFLIQKYQAIELELLKKVTFGLTWIFSVVDAIVESISIASIIQHLAVRTNNCQLFNRYAIFQNFVVGYPWQKPSTPSSSFESWLDEFTSFGQHFTRDDPFTVSNLDSFARLCRTLPECSVDASGLACVVTDPTLQESGGAAFSTFLIVVWTVVAVRLLVEVCQLVIVLLSLRRQSLVPGVLARFHVQSIWGPMLLCSSSPYLKRQFVSQIVSTPLQPKDYLFRLIYAGVLSSIPLLFVKIYFLLVVSQTGLTVQNWISLVTGLVVVPQLISQAAYLFWQVRNAKSETAASMASSDATISDSSPSNPSNSVEFASADSTRIAADAAVSVAGVFYPAIVRCPRRRRCVSVACVFIVSVDIGAYPGQHWALYCFARMFSMGILFKQLGKN
jgi:hypothetical protein